MTTLPTVMAVDQSSITIHAFIEGTCKPQPRHRKGDHGNYTPDSVLGWRERIWAVLIQQRPATPHIGPVKMELFYRMARPVSHFGSGKNAGTIKPKHADVRHLSVPDLDNLEKALKDECQQLGVYHNDSQVWHVVKSKVWANDGHRPGLDLTVILEKTEWQQRELARTGT